MRPFTQPALAACTLAPLWACGPTDEEPPRLEEARFDGDQAVILSFSEPLGPVAEVDPSAHFRIGSAFVIDDLEGGVLTAYYDLAHHFQDGVPGEQGDELGPVFRHGGIEVAAIERGDAPDELRLVLTYPIESYACQAVLAARALDIPAAIHVHTRQGSFPRIEDEAGNPLAEIGAWWITAPFADTQPGSFPLLDPRVEIPCP